MFMNLFTWIGRNMSILFNCNQRYGNKMENEHNNEPDAPSNVIDGFRIAQPILQI
jgi:hypothetical protein